MTGEGSTWRGRASSLRVTKLGMPELRNRQKMVDIIAYSSGKKMVVSDRNRALPKPVERRGHEQLRRIFQGCKARAVYATAFARRTLQVRRPTSPGGGGMDRR